MREDIWKYISVVLTLLLAVSSVAIVMLYTQNSALRVSNIPANTSSSVVINRLNVTCNTTISQLQLEELRRQIEFLKAQLQEKNARRTNTTVVIVPIFGLIDDTTALKLVPLLRDIAKNDSISGVILWIESPGGYVGPVREIYSTIRKLKLLKPVVAYTGGMAASGGYYIAVGANKIIADPLAEVGSIGVIYVHYDMERNYQMNGISVDVFKTGPHKDMGAEWRGLTEEEKKIIANTIDTYFQDFLRAVSDGRNMTVEEVKKYATGRTWFAVNVTGRLVDETGDLDTAISVLSATINATNPKVIVYESTMSSDFEVIGSVALFLDPEYVSLYLRR